MYANLSCRPGYPQIIEIPRFGFLKQVHVLLTCHAVLDVMNKQYIVCKHVFDSLALKMISRHHGDHGPLGNFLNTLYTCNATGARISIYTARNRLRGARLIFEF